MKAKNNAPAQTAAKKPYNSRIWTGFTLSADTERNYDKILVSAGNIWTTTVSKSGTLYGRLPITGKYALRDLATLLGVDAADMEETEWITLFFWKNDAEWLEKGGETKHNRTIVIRIDTREDADGNTSIIGQVVKLL